jgi:hypothetical protein
MSPAEGDDFLVRFIKREFDRQCDLGIDGDLTETDLISFGRAVRAEIWREVLLRPRGDGGAA